MKMKILMALAAALLVVPNGSALLVKTYDPVGIGTGRAADVLGAVLTCTDQYGSTGVYEIVDQQAGQYFTVTILKEIGGSDLRASWNSQLAMTHEAVNSYISQNGGAWVGNKAFEQGMTATCGETVGYVPSSGNVRVKLEFGGVDVQYTSSSTTTYSITVSVEVQSKFEISLTNAGVSQQWNFGVSGTWVYSTTTQVEIKGTKKIYTGPYITSTTMGPIEDLISSLTVSTSSSSPDVDVAALSAFGSDPLQGLEMEAPVIPEGNYISELV